MSGPRYHRSRAQDQRLEAFECDDCGWISFPENRRICKRCGRTPASYSSVSLQHEGTLRTFVVQEFLPDEFDTPMPVGMVDLPQDGEGEPARVYGLFTETDLEELVVDMTVVARFRELFDDGDRPINAIKFSVPRREKL